MKLSFHTSQADSPSVLSKNLESGNFLWFETCRKKTCPDPVYNAASWHYVIDQ